MPDDSQNEYALSEQSIRKLKKLMGDYENGKLFNRPQRAFPIIKESGHVFAQCYGTIPAADDELCPGRGEVKILKHLIETDEDACLEQTEELIEVFNPAATEFADGDIVIIQREARDGQWWIIPTGSGTQVIHYELIEGLPFGGSALAHKLYFDGNSWEIDEEADPINVIDWYGDMWSGGEEYRGLAVPRGSSNEVMIGEEYVTIVDYDIVWQEMVAETIEFTTTQFMGENGAYPFVNAAVDSYDNQGLSPGSSVDVHDPSFRFLDVDSGAHGSAKMDYSTGQYIIVSCQRLALYAHCYINSDVDMCGSGLEFDEDINGFEIEPIGMFVSEGNSEETEILNPLGFAACGGAFIKLRRVNNDPDETIWEVIGVTKQSVQIIIDHRITEEYEFQFKKRTAFVEWCDCEEPEWETYVTGVACPPPEE